MQTPSTGLHVPANGSDVIGKVHKLARLSKCHQNVIKRISKNYQKILKILLKEQLYPNTNTNTNTNWQDCEQWPAAVP